MIDGKLEARLPQFQKLGPVPFVCSKFVKLTDLLHVPSGDEAIYHNARLVTDNEISGLCEVYSTLDFTTQQETGFCQRIWAYTCCAIRTHKLNPYRTNVENRVSS